MWPARRPPPRQPCLCAGCARWVDLTVTVLWGDRLTQLCCECAAGYEQLRLRPESVHLHWRLPGDT
jgi:hypothetical protein